ncbi:hypothetical protein ACI2KR_08440 [Pseudomonas luteola]
MNKFPVSSEDILEALEQMPKNLLADAIVADRLGESMRDSEQFGRHLNAVKNQNIDTIVPAALQLVMRYSRSITESTGCFLDKDQKTPLDFESAMRNKLEQQLGALDCALTGSNPALAAMNARGIINDWNSSKIGTICKKPLSNGDLSVEYRVGSSQLAVTPKAILDESKFMEASPILNELSSTLRNYSERRLGRSYPEQGLNM